MATITNSKYNPIVAGFVNLESKPTYVAVTQHWTWTHTIGRISNLVRIPFLLTSVAFQASVTIIKALINAPVIELIGGLVYLCEGEAGWTEYREITRILNYGGVRDGIINTLATVDRTIAAGVNVLLAPPKAYRSFGVETLSILDIGGVLTKRSLKQQADKYLSVAAVQGSVTIVCLKNTFESCFGESKEESKVD